MYFVYTLFNIKNGKFYVGKSNNPYKRWKDHSRLALIGSNDCPKIYGAIRKYGIENLEFSIIQSFNNEKESLAAESYYIRFFNAIKFGYNCLEDVDSREGYITSEETKIKQSIKRFLYYEKNNHHYLNKNREEGTKEKISKTLINKFVGENSFNTKLINNQRLEIIKLVDEGKSQKYVANMYNVSTWSIYNIIKKRHLFEDLPEPKNTYDEYFKKRKHNLDWCQEIAKLVDPGGKCLSAAYVNTKTKMEWQCSQNHIWFALPSNVAKKHWCDKCSRLNRGPYKKHVK